MECTASPSLSSSRRSPSDSSMTRAYWYSVSRSQITLPELVADFVVPTGTTSRPAMTTLTTTPGTHWRPRPGTATRASTSANSRNVRCVPTTGISSRAARKVPVSEPIVPMAYSRPATRPASSTWSTFRRTAYGETMPSSSTGTAISTPTPSRDPTNRPPESSSNAVTDRCRNGPLTNGTSASIADAHTTHHERPRIVGLRSASRPPRAYPIDRATSTVAMVLAQTIVLAPNHGA